MTEVTTGELKDLINAVHKAVDDSNFGPVYVFGGTAEDPKKIVSPAAFQIFVSLVTTLSSKMDTIKLIKEEGPSALVQ